VAGSNSIRLVPFMLTKPVIMSDLAAKIGTADAAGLFQLAVYASDPATKLPTGLPLAATADMSAAATGFVSADIVGSNVAFQPGLYWQAICTNSATAAFTVFATTMTIANALVGTATLANLGNSTANGALVRALVQTYGTWPDLTSATLTESFSNGSAALAFKAA
jgi:hypothetical protein